MSLRTALLDRIRALHGSMSARSLALIGILLPLLFLFLYVAVRSGPLAPVSVVAASVETQSLEPALFGVGTVEARYTYRIGPTFAGRVQRVDVQVGDFVKAGQVLGEMDPVDLDDRIRAQQAAIRRAEASALAAEAQIKDAEARRTYAAAQGRRYEELLKAHTVSKEAVEGKQQEYQIAEAGLSLVRANLAAARQELARVRSEYDVLRRQRANLQLVAPADGLVASRRVDPGATVVAGEAVVEVIDPASLWINVRFDQLRSAGLRAGLPATVVLRSRPEAPLSARVLRLEPVADAVTEELLAKIVLDESLASTPAIGELAEVTVQLPPTAPTPVISDASVQRVGGRLGVWLVEASDLEFRPVKLGVASLDGRVQIIEGLTNGQQVVVYSERALRPRSRIKLVERMPGVSL
ncbi:MAG: efflux RND transporter periplasmic adaptor subunit [Steroidobacteraceae bacterium]|jgi:RND family efflux transporter MFP subunit|nr:efflux RND transporter periplasmic adaptor subunit [Steroidobacteraceae bacterium]